MVPGSYEDLELADLVVLVGSNLAWCHPVLYQRIAAAKAARPATQIVVIDPRRTDDRRDRRPAPARSRRTATSRCSTGCSRYLARTGRARPRLHRAHTRRASTRRCGRAAATASPASPPRRGLEPSATCARSSTLFAAHAERRVTVYSARASTSRRRGTDKVNAIINCHLATGRIGKPGHGAVLGHRPAQRHGRTRGRRPGQHARRPSWISTTRRTRARAALLGRAEHRHASRA